MTEGYAPLQDQGLAEARPLAPGTLKKRSVVIAGHPTSVSLEVAFWEALKEIARSQGTSAAALIADIDEERTSNLSSAIRVFVLEHLRRAAVKQ